MNGFLHHSHQFSAKFIGFDHSMTILDFTRMVLFSTSERKLAKIQKNRKVCSDQIDLAARKVDQIRQTKNENIRKDLF